MPWSASGGGDGDGVDGADLLGLEFPFDQEGGKRSEPPKSRHPCCPGSRCQINLRTQKLKYYKIN